MKQKTLKTAKITAAFLFTCGFGLEIRPFIAELDLMNMPNVLIKLKVEMLHSVTPLVQFLIQFFSFGKYCRIMEMLKTQNLLSHQIMPCHSFLSLRSSSILNAKEGNSKKKPFFSSPHHVAQFKITFPVLAKDTNK